MPGLVGELVEKGLQKITGAMEQRGVGKTALSLFGNQEYEAKLTEGGQKFLEMHKDYIKGHDDFLTTVGKDLKAMRDWHSGDSTARNALPEKTATIGEYHQHAVATGHPIQAITKKILASDVDPATGISRNTHLTQRQLAIKHESLARLAGLHVSYGDHFENMAPIIADELTNKDPRIRSHGARLAQILSNQVRDTKEVQTVQGTKNMQAFSAVEMNKAFQLSNKMVAKMGEGTRIPMLNTDPTYIKPGELERKAHRILSMQLAGFAAIEHVGTLFNIPASSPATAIGKYLLHMDHAEMKQTVEATSILASTQWRDMYRDILGETGMVSEFSHSPALGRLIAQGSHQPGLSLLRKWEIKTAGAVGYHSTILWAHNATKGSQIAVAQLKQMGLNPDEIIKRGGQLTEEELQKGVYHFANDRMFFNKTINTSLWQNKNLFTRSGFMFQSFIKNQSSFMRNELLLRMKAGDYAGVAQFVATLGIVLPVAAAPLLEGLKLLARTGSFSQAKQKVTGIYQTLDHPLDDPKTWMITYATLAAHAGAASIYMNYLNAIAANRLLGAVAGPIFGTPVAVGTDAWNAAFKTSKKTGEHDVKPLERDALKFGVPVFGSALAHGLVPTVADDKAEGRGHSKNSLRTRRGHSSRRGRRKEE